LISKAKQVQAMQSYLDKWLDRAEETEDEISTADLAKEIVEGFHTLLEDSLTSPAPLVPHVGMAFKVPWASGVQFVGHIEGNRVWIINTTSQYGSFAPVDGPLWGRVEPSKAAKGGPGNNPDYNPGDRLSRAQRRYSYEVIATGDKCVLLKDVRTGELTSDSNSNIERYYQREKSSAGRTESGDSGTGVHRNVDLFG
jgi:hypothetical protein